MSPCVLVEQEPLTTTVDNYSQARYLARLH